MDISACRRAASMTRDPGTRIRVSEDILARFPTFRLRLLYAFGIRNRPSDATSREWLRDGALRGLAALGGMRPGEHPHLCREVRFTWTLISFASHRFLQTCSTMRLSTHPAVAKSGLRLR